MGAQTVGHIRRAGKVWVGGLVANSCSSALGNAVQPLVGAINAATVARANVGAVENVLDRQVNVDRGGLSGNFHAITKSRDSPMSPA